MTSELSGLAWLVLGACSLAGCALPSEGVHGVGGTPPSEPAQPQRWIVNGPAATSIIVPPDDPLCDLAAWDAVSTARRAEIAAAVAAKIPGLGPAELHMFECGAQRHELAVFRHEPSAIELVLVPGGRVEYRADADGACVSAWSGPLLVARTEVTNRTWIRVMGATPLPATEPDAPVAASFDDAAAFCRAEGLALPSAAQWEWSACGGARTRFCFGDDVALAGDYAWLADNSRKRLHPVAEKRPNAFGLFDTLGNAREWCRDEPGDPRRRTARGGGADSRAESCCRSRPSEFRSWQYGFRPVLEVPVLARTSLAVR